MRKRYAWLGLIACILLSPFLPDEFGEEAEPWKEEEDFETR